MEPDMIASGRMIKLTSMGDSFMMMEHIIEEK